jgi:uncharacterized membrane protein YdjX (TVP38/TMEM64 family)/membrane-associated phospholipid phosphatase
MLKQKWYRILGWMSLVYSLSVYIISGQDIIYFIACLIVAGVLMTKTRHDLFCKISIPLILHFVIYDSLRFYIGALQPRIFVEEPYRIEKALFGISTAAGTLTPNEFFRIHHCIPADIFCALAYFLFWFVPICFAAYLYWKRNETRLITFAWSFLALNCFGYLIYVLYPAAPPWYVAEYGFAPVVSDVAGSAAALTRVDALIGINVFQAYYSKTSAVFGAIPSLHVAYTFLTLCFAFQRYPRWVLPLCVYILSVNVAAVYLDHHYVIDIILGNLLAYAVFLFAMRITDAYSRRSTDIPNDGTRQDIIPVRLVGITLLTAIILAAVILKRYGFLSTGAVVEFFKTHPVFAPALFILLFAVMACLFISTFIITIAAGFLWGPVWGLLIVMTGSTLGSTVSFLVSRYLAGNYFRLHLQNPRWLQLQRLFHRRGWLAVACARILPIFPFALINYFFGITSIRFSEYLWSSFVFILPSTFVLVLCGSMTKDLTVPTSGVTRLILFAAGIAMLGLLLLFRHIFRKYLPVSGTGSEM